MRTGFDEAHAHRREFFALRYLEVKSAVIDAGYAEEVDWQEDLRFERVSESDFLRETAWVILSAGMREAVIRNKFALLGAVLWNFGSARKLAFCDGRSRRRALRIFNHPGKIDAIISAGQLVNRRGFEETKKRICAYGLSYLQTFPFIGPVTCYHLAKNLGLDVVKPDRHLVRVAKRAGYGSPAELCAEIAAVVGEKVSVIDVVLWRYATLKPDYVRMFDYPARRMPSTR